MITDWKLPTQQGEVVGGLSLKRVPQPHITFSDIILNPRIAGSIKKITLFLSKVLVLIPAQSPYLKSNEGWESPGYYSF